ncbi:YgcG family protein [uncultured Paracoccus sp.]|uniref:TPM domain-containing protein n=1 Tax=uncultured Paracoccus sp. TaxID=189685 RepID=UPI002612FD50|nr:TPM domain-containing protein [uncultured Paracoccus sp.]
MIRAILLWLILALPAAAQSLPDWEYTSINDFAGLLSNDDTRILDQALIALHDQTGIEGTVVTIEDRRYHGGQSGLEPFATRLFNYWGVGDKRRNDGFMVMVLPANREARIELGAGYSPAFDGRAATIMERAMLPAFGRGDYSTGLREGTLAVIDQIARPHAQGRLMPPPGLSTPDRNRPPIGFIIALLLAAPLVVVWLRSLFEKRCPQCDGRNLTETAEPILNNKDDEGWEVSQHAVKRQCRDCGWHTTLTRNLGYTEKYAIDGVFLGRTNFARYGLGSRGSNYNYDDYDNGSSSRRRDSSSSGSSSSGRSGGYGGGSSRGGGASGRW